MGAAEVGRELGDAGGPLLVGALAAAITLTPALLVFGGLLTATAALIPHLPAAGDIHRWRTRSPERHIEAILRRAETRLLQLTGGQEPQRPLRHNKRSATEILQSEPARIWHSPGEPLTDDQS